MSHILTHTLTHTHPEQDAYGLEKLMTEELLMHYDADFGMEVRVRVRVRARARVRG